MKVRRKLAMLKREHYFDQARDARCPFGMAQVGLDRAKRNGVDRFCHRPRRAPHLDRVARKVPCMRFNVAHVFRLDLRIRQRLAITAS